MANGASTFIFTPSCLTLSLQALGEAEAELAWLNRQGVIDAIISDDVDAIVFGAVNTMKK